MVDVLTETRIERPREVVAAFAADPDNTRRWYSNIEQVDWQTERPLQVGTRLGFVARFLGRRLEYTYEVTEYAPGDRLVMRTAQGPFPMETTYAWFDDGAGTRMQLRNRGRPTGFAKLAGIVMSPAVRRANRKDLARLKQMLEAG